MKCRANNLVKKCHGKRLKNKFYDGGSEAIPDYELLELILFRVIQRRDTKTLLEKFKSFAKFINAPEYLLCGVPGVGTAFAREFSLIKASAARLSKNERLNRNALTSWDQVLDYGTNVMRYESR